MIWGYPYFWKHPYLFQHVKGAHPKSTYHRCMVLWYLVASLDFPAWNSMWLLHFRETGWTASTWKRATKGQPLEIRTTAGETQDLHTVLRKVKVKHAPTMDNSMVWKLLRFGDQTSYIWSLLSGRLWPALELSRMVLQHLLWCAAFP